MDQLWAPWRLAYVTKAAPTPDCFICHGLSQTADRENLIVCRRETCVVMLNKFPYNNGHLLVAPLSHKAKLAELSQVEMLEMQQVLTEFAGIIETTMKADGFNIGLNLGKVAGAGLPGHLHWHIVPRWNGDTNFMPVLTDVRVIVQSLDALYDLLTNHLQSAS